MYVYVLQFLMDGILSFCVSDETIFLFVNIFNTCYMQADRGRSVDTVN